MINNPIFFSESSLNSKIIYERLLKKSKFRLKKEISNKISFSTKNINFCFQFSTKPRGI